MDNFGGGLVRGESLLGTLRAWKRMVGSALRGVTTTQELGVAWTARD